MPPNKINMRPVHPEAERINAEVDEDPDVSDEDIRRAREMAAARGEPVDLRSESDRRKGRFAILLQSAPPEGITPTQLKRGSGLSESWVYLTLGKLADQGAVTKPDRGRYAPVAGVSVEAALEAIRREGDDLVRQANDLVGGQL